MDPTDLRGQLLVGKVADGGPTGLKAGTKVTKTYLNDLASEHGRDRWLEIRLRSEESAQQLEAVAEQIAQRQGD